MPALSPDRLQVFVFGPGTGELVAVRAPPDAWLVVDGCGVAGNDYGPLLLKGYGARPKIVVFTHPHLDHAKGIQRVVEESTASSDLTQWPRIGLLLPRASILDPA